MISAVNAKLEPICLDDDANLKRKAEIAILNAINEGKRKINFYCPLKHHYSLMKFLKKNGYSVEDNLEYFYFTISW